MISDCSGQLTFRWRSRQIHLDCLIDLASATTDVHAEVGLIFHTRKETTSVQDYCLNSGNLLQFIEMQGRILAHIQLLCCSLLLMESCLYRAKYFYSKRICMLVHYCKKKKATFFKRFPSFVFLLFFSVLSPLVPIEIVYSTDTSTLIWWRALKCFGTHFSSGEKAVSNILCLLNLPLSSCPSMESHQIPVLFPQWDVSGLHSISISHNEYLMVEM